MQAQSKPRNDLLILTCNTDIFVQFFCHLTFDLGVFVDTCLFLSTFSIRSLIFFHFMVMVS